MFRGLRDTEPACRILTHQSWKTPNISDGPKQRGGGPSNVRCGLTNVQNWWNAFREIGFKVVSVSHLVNLMLDSTCEIVVVVVQSAGLAMWGRFDLFSFSLIYLFQSPSLTCPFSPMVIPCLFLGKRKIEQPRKSHKWKIIGNFGKQRYCLMKAFSTSISDPDLHLPRRIVQEFMF